ncbi:sodium:proton antiporter [Dysgonomonas sp. 216]|uniref:cation:proton antiporter domain-containing protein n=1 Tax=Dysgonomonas sp. 216 TaxID=2302934 RepID=UPI0013D029A8|nr:cation:proton antiporter [Dysgonomonas sp. 216]NDW19808.1 sodium:proton antiporter [Dysgonomonas sp. 216]
MGHLPDLISDLAIILITAGIVTIIFKWLKQPVVLGYIVAGFIAGPHFWIAPTIMDTANISTWAEIGVIFLLFALGLEFSFKKLLSVGGTASIATLINMGSMIAIGYLVGQLLGWTHMDSLFLGGMLSMSSTTIIIKAFNDMGLQKQKFAGIVFGMLIVEDLAAILMMVLLSTIAVSQNFEGMELVSSILKLVFFMIIWFVVGIYMIPTLLKKFKQYLNDETLLIVAVGMCLGMVLFANAVGFSAALGAFIMGSVLAETEESKHIEHLVEPLKNLFGAVFFVSVGMMIAPDIIVEYAIPILILTSVVLIGRIIFATLGVVASGEGLKVAIQAGFSLAQIGEFSFIIATLGMQLGVIDSFLYPIIVAVSVITTFTTPYCIKWSGKVYSFTEKRIPSNWNKLIDGYASSGSKSIDSESEWSKFIKSILVSVAIYFTLSLAVLLACRQLLIPFVTSNIDGTWGRVVAAGITLILMSPFLSAMVLRKSRSSEFEKLWNSGPFNKGALSSIMILRAFLGVGFIVIALSPLFPQATALLVIIAILVVAIFTFTKAFKAPATRMEERFRKNLSDKENAENQNSAINKKLAADLLYKDLHIEEFEISQESPIAGQTLGELNFRQSTGVNIVSIIRGEIKINIPGANERLFPFDIIVVVGTDKQVEKFNEKLQNTQTSYGEIAEHHIEIAHFSLKGDSLFIGQTVQNANLKENWGCMIIGIDRLNESIVNITPDIKFEEGDIVWIAGESYNLKNLKKKVINHIKE